MVEDSLYIIVIVVVVLVAIIVTVFKDVSAVFMHSQLFSGHLVLPLLLKLSSGIRHGLACLSE